MSQITLSDVETILYLTKQQKKLYVKVLFKYVRGIAGRWVTVKQENLYQRFQIPADDILTFSVRCLKSKGLI